MPCLVRPVGAGGVPRLGHGLLDDYLEMVAARARPNTVLATAFDFLVADDCVAKNDCAGVRPFLAAGKPVYLVAYTNVPHRMDAYCALAAKVGAPLIFKAQSLNGKLHRRCLSAPTAR